MRPPGRPGETRIGEMPSKQDYIGGRLFTVGEVASMLRVSNMTVYRLIKSGEMPALRVGKNYRIRASDVNQYLSDRAVGGGGG